MKTPLVLEFKEIIKWPGAPELSFRPVVYDTPRLTAAVSDSRRPKGSDRLICRTVNGLVRLRLITPDGWLTNDFGYGSGIATAALMGAYSGKAAVIQEHTTGPIGLGFDTTGIVQGKNPLTASSNSVHTVANMSAGGYGFDYFSSYANLAEEIFIRVQIGNLGSFLPSPGATFEISGALIAADPG